VCRLGQAWALRWTCFDVVGAIKTTHVHINTCVLIDHHCQVWIYHKGKLGFHAPVASNSYRHHAPSFHEESLSRQASANSTESVVQFASPQAHFLKCHSGFIWNISALPLSYIFHTLNFILTLWVSFPTSCHTSRQSTQGDGCIQAQSGLVEKFHDLSKSRFPLQLTLQLSRRLKQQLDQLQFIRHILSNCYSATPLICYNRFTVITII
jgi:hypothetical protein